MLQIANYIYNHFPFTEEEVDENNNNYREVLDVGGIEKIVEKYQRLITEINTLYDSSFTNDNFDEMLANISNTSYKEVILVQKSEDPCNDKYHYMNNKVVEYTIENLDVQIPDKEKAIAVIAITASLFRHRKRLDALKKIESLAFQLIILLTALPSLFYRKDLVVPSIITDSKPMRLTLDSYKVLARMANKSKKVFYEWYDYPFFKGDFPVDISYIYSDRRFEEVPLFSQYYLGTLIKLENGVNLNPEAVDLPTNRYYWTKIIKESKSPRELLYRLDIPVLDSMLGNHNLMEKIMEKIFPIAKRQPKLDILEYLFENASKEKRFSKVFPERITAKCESCYQSLTFEDSMCLGLKFYCSSCFYESSTIQLRRFPKRLTGHGSHEDILFYILDTLRSIDSN